MTENLFGKMRGRFDEAAAERQDRTLVEAAMSAICAMPSDEFTRFRATFRHVYWRGPDLDLGPGAAPDSCLVPRCPGTLHPEGNVGGQLLFSCDRCAQRFLEPRP